jgi:hypothetical protein
MIKLTPIKPKASAINFAAAEKAVRETMEDLAKELQKDLEDTTDGWSHKVEFKIKQERDGYTVSTDDPIWRYGDDGTKPHDIYPSRRKMLRFVTGGDVVFARHVRHPGTKANNWSKMLQKQYQDEVPHRLNVEIASSIGGH